MKAFFALLRVSFKSLLITTFSAGRGKRKGARAATGIGAFVLLSLLMIYLSGTYSFLLASTFATYNGLDVMLMLMSLMALIFPFIFIMFASQSLVYSTKDVDLVLSLPVSFFSVMLARVLALYLESLLMVELMLIPAGVAYLWHGGAGGAPFILLVVVAGLFLALVPTLLSLIVGAVIAALVSRMRFKNLFSVLFSLLLVVGIMAMSLSFTSAASAAESGLLNIAPLRAQLVSAFPPLLWVWQFFSANPVGILKVVGTTLLPFLLVVWVFSRFYKSLLTRLSSHTLRTNYRLRGLKTRGSFGALFAKEAGRFFGTPAYLFNSGFGILLIVVASVAAVVFKARIDEFLVEMAGVGVSLGAFITPLLLAALCFFTATINVTSVCISLEGKTLWILREAPLSTTKIFAAKVGFNFALHVFAVVVCVPLLAVAFGLAPVDAVIMAVLALLFGALASMLGLLINLFLPRMDAENDTVVVKQSASVLVNMLADIVFIALFALLYVAVGGFGFAVFGLGAAALLLCLNAATALLLNTTGKKLFARL